MIKKHCFEQDWLDHFKKQKDYKRIDKIILQKMIYALHLLESLKTNGLDFVFKGGTSLVLLLEESNRFSIDIDIICNANRQELEGILQKVVESSQFNSFELDDHRSYKTGVPKAHYRFNYDTDQKGSGTILLDLLIEKSLYPGLIEVPIQTKWIETEDETLVTVPSIDSITGDKLTAFAPNTIGIPYFKGKDNRSFSMEICKQLFDVSNLFERIENIEEVKQSFDAFAKQEIAYRKSENPNLDLTPKKVLQDTIDTCITIAKRGKGSNIEKQNFNELQKGIKAFGTSYIMTGRFRMDQAISATARIVYLAAKLLKNDMSIIEYFEGQDISDITIEDEEWNFLNPLKKMPDKSSFYYWNKTIELLTKEN